MNRIEKKYLNQLILSIVGILVLLCSQSAFGQEWRWLRIGQLQDLVTERGAEVEDEGPNRDSGNDNLYWPAAYGLDQYNSRSKGLWIGCRNFYATKAQESFGGIS